MHAPLGQCAPISHWIKKKKSAGARTLAGVNPAHLFQKRPLALLILTYLSIIFPSVISLMPEFISKYRKIVHRFHWTMKIFCHSVICSFFYQKAGVWGRLFYITMLYDLFVPQGQGIPMCWRLQPRTFSRVKQTISCVLLTSPPIQPLNRSCSEAIKLQLLLLLHP